MMLWHLKEFAFVVSTFLLITVVHSQDIRFGTESPGIQRSPPRRSCDVSHYCTPLRHCRPLRSLPDWDTAGDTCGSGNGPSRRVCCPRQSSGGRNPATRPPPTVNRPRPEPPRTEPVDIPPDVIINNDTPACGQSRIGSFLDPHVTGGENATEGEWPWMVAITRRGRSGVYTPWCTGFLIDRRHVISAAHCFPRIQDGLYSTRIGAVNQNEGEVFPVSNIVVHEGYRRNMFYNDIAVLTLTREVNSRIFNPICLPDEQLASRSLVGVGTTVAGWGAEKDNGQPSIILKQASAIPVVSIQDCNSVYRDRVPGFKRDFPRGINGGFICAGHGGKDACGGDSGGPLMYQARNRWFAVGIVSFGFSCGEPGIPGGYTRVSSQLRWITENTRN